MNSPKFVAQYALDLVSPIFNQGVSAIPFVPSNAVSVSSFIQNSGTLKRNYQGKSEIWKCFQIYNEKQYSNLAFCILCNSDINYGKTHSTSTLDQHLQRRHVEEFNSLMVEKANKRLCTDVPKQSKLTDFINVKS
jgi:hypothetical protein